MKKQFKIGIDIDNVIADTATAYLDLFNKTYEKSIEFEQIHDFFYMEKYSGIPTAEVERFVREKLEQDAFTLTIRPYGQASGVIAHWSQKGYSIHYITARSPEAKHATRQWLTTHGFWQKHATLDTHDPSIHANASAYKAIVGRKLGINVMIEDYVEYAAAMPDIPVLLLDRPWNRVSLPAHVTRVQDWDAIKKEVYRLAGAP